MHTTFRFFLVRMYDVRAVENMLAAASLDFF